MKFVKALKRYEKVQRAHWDKGVYYFFKGGTLSQHMLSGEEKVAPVTMGELNADDWVGVEECSFYSSPKEEHCIGCGKKNKYFNQVVDNQITKIIKGQRACKHEEYYKPEEKTALLEPGSSSSDVNPFKATRAAIVLKRGRKKNE